MLGITHQIIASNGVPTRMPTIMYKAIDQEIAHRLRLVRRSKRMTQSELGQALSVTFQQIQKYERGQNRLPVSRLVELVKIMDMSPSDLLGFPPTPEWSLSVWDAVRMAQAIDADDSRSLWLELGRTLAGMILETD